MARRTKRKSNLRKRRTKRRKGKRSSLCNCKVIVEKVVDVEVYKRVVLHYLDSTFLLQLERKNRWKN
jgi:hypothetical protein